MNYRFPPSFYSFQYVPSPAIIQPIAIATPPFAFQQHVSLTCSNPSNLIPSTPPFQTLQSLTSVPSLSSVQSIPTVQNLQPVQSGKNAQSNQNLKNFSLDANLTPVRSHTRTKKVGEDLKSSIQAFVKSFEGDMENTQQISVLSTKFNIKRRRLYDVINVLEAIGCCEKSGLDSVRWYGLNNITVTLDKLKIEKHIHDPLKNLCDMFPVPCCVGISSLTQSFLLMFFALKTDRIDLRYVSQFFSRTTTRYKTTLCKLYQICYILSAIGVTTRTSQVCEITLNSPFYNEEVIEAFDDDYQKNSNEHEEQFAISNLLNHPNKNGINYIHRRREEIKQCYDEAETDKNEPILDDTYEAE
ncbi:hypothetical protein TRFO_02686 [Tritrichomonas foetus]|uniref:E2F/DP family winged-helix DNA-binding domain-containing protein n=1 Tax=Tritrichomonas foetus TaxID=1144522 RepID=A0A1J4L3A1_9EUKA|nr:hypothetical protein TRFO_02686 [Tritrichomonas foetus]|eukprot:OHT16430.1 hypothetical protein TRFO_02686 [Tritrichomonas foetus]